MKARVRDDRKPSHHAVPADTSEDGGNEVGPEGVVAKQHDDGVEKNTQSGDQHAPKVQAIAPLEPVDQGNENLNAVVPSNSETASYGHVNRERS